MPSDKYPLPNDPAARALREARARFNAQRSGGASPLQEKTPHSRPRYGSGSGYAIDIDLQPETTNVRITEQHPIKSAADLAPLIRASRKRMKMSQQQFADAVGVGRRFLSELENGKPSLEFDKVLACALGAGIDLSAKPRRPL